MRPSVTPAFRGLALCWLLAGRASGSEPPSERPTDRELREAVRRLLGPTLDPNRCGIVERQKNFYSIECSTTECQSCNVTHVITSLIRKNGKWAIAGTRRERRGDTGECGCCM